MFSHDEVICKYNEFHKYTECIMVREMFLFTGKFFSQIILCKEFVGQFLAFKDNLFPQMIKNDKNKLCLSNGDFSGQ